MNYLIVTRATPLCKIIRRGIHSSAGDTLF